MKRLMLPLALSLSACGGEPAELNEVEIDRAAQRLTKQADKVVNAQINEIIAEEADKGGEKAAQTVDNPPPRP